MNRTALILLLAYAMFAGSCAKTAEDLLKSGNEYFQKKNYDRAIVDYTAVLRIKPDDYQVLHNRGLAYHEKGDLDNAIADYEAVLKIAPDYAATKVMIELAKLMKEVLESEER